MIRNFSTDMLDECATLYVEVFNGEPWNESWTAERAKKYLDEFVNKPRFIGYIAEEKGKIVGALFGCEKTWQSGTEMFIDELYVSSGMQGKGIGTSLMAAAEEHARRSGLTSVTLLTSSDKPAMNFYCKHGYSCADEFRFLYKDIK